MSHFFSIFSFFFFSFLFFFKKKTNKNPKNAGRSMKSPAKPWELSRSQTAPGPVSRVASSSPSLAPAVPPRTYGAGAGAAYDARAGYGRASPYGAMGYSRLITLTLFLNFC